MTKQSEALVEELAESALNVTLAAFDNVADCDISLDEIRDALAESTDDFRRAILPIIETQLASAKEQAERLAEALRPFAEHEDFHAPDDWPVTQYDNGSERPEPGVTAGDFRRARAALAAWEKSCG